MKLEERERERERGSVCQIEIQGSKKENKSNIHSLLLKCLEKSAYTVNTLVPNVIILMFLNSICENIFQSILKIIFAAVVFNSPIFINDYYLLNNQYPSFKT